MPDMHWPGLAGRFEDNPLWVERLVLVRGQPGAYASLLDHGLKGGGLRGKGKLPRQGRFDLTGQRVPLLEGPWRETAKRADGPLPGPLGGMHRLDQEIVGVGFPLGNFGRFSDVHRTLYTLYSQAKSREEFIIFVTIYKAKALHGKSSTYKTYGPLWSQNRVSSAEVGLETRGDDTVHIDTVCASTVDDELLTDGVGCAMSDTPDPAPAELNA